MGQAELEERLFELVGYMVTSGRNLLDETSLYGPFRLLDAASRLILLLEDEEIISSRLSTIRERIDAGKYSVMTSPGEFRTFLDSLVDALVDHMNPGKEKGGDQLGKRTEISRG
ncbi:hypothetical protein KAU37_04305 [Candidatus Bipolaricaulota bacterium]|nr:hypothetical protein [Candidatus Bipolaricaulota bacterium]